MKAMWPDHLPHARQPKRRREISEDETSPMVVVVNGNTADAEIDFFTPRLARSPPSFTAPPRLAPPRLDCVWAGDVSTPPGYTPLCTPRTAPTGCLAALADVARRCAAALRRRSSEPRRCE